MKEIKKKIWPVYFERVLSGKKNFDLRLADFDVNEGDVIVFEEWDRDKKEYTGRKIEKKVKYLDKTKDSKYWSKEDIDKFGFLVIGF
jgi:ASC-1-like (ASCH) protein